MALADQISREFKGSDQGMDMEIEFNDDAHEATGAKLTLQLNGFEMRRAEVTPAIHEIYHRLRRALRPRVRRFRRG